MREVENVVWHAMMKTRAPKDFGILHCT